MNKKSIIRDIIPPALRMLGNRLIGATITHRGPYVDWEAAKIATNGYNDDAILRRVSAATKLVLSGAATFEQDGIAKRELAPPSEVITALMMAASLSRGRLSVVDFGGGLGSHYLRWRDWLSSLEFVYWTVVEQQKYVEEGRLIFSEDEQVKFVSALENPAEPPSAILASSSLQYVDDPIRVLDKLVLLHAKVFVLDRTPFSKDESMKILSQHVPRQLGRASYPLWTLPKRQVFDRLSAHYDLLREFPSEDAPIKGSHFSALFEGSVWIRRELP